MPIREMMNRFSLRTCAALVALGWTAATTASAQTTKPSDQAATKSAAKPAEKQPATWAAAVERVARAAEKGDLDGVTAALSRDASVRTIEEDDRVPPIAMAATASDWTLLGTHAYEFPPASLAGDIAADVNRSDLVSDKDKQKIVPLDDVELARANTTAAEWLARTVGAERDSLVGVAVYWNVKTNRPMFVLVKGQPITGGGFAVTQAVYGDPMQRRATAAAR